MNTETETRPQESRMVNDDTKRHFKSVLSLSVTERIGVGVLTSVISAGAIGSVLSAQKLSAVGRDVSNLQSASKDSLKSQAETNRLLWQSVQELNRTMVDVRLELERLRSGN